MNKSWIISLLFFSLLSCRTQEEINDKMNKDYSKEWQVIDNNIEQGFPEKAILGLDELITSARQNGDHIVATRAVLQRINLKNLDQVDFMQNQLPILQKELEENDDPVSGTILNYTTALIYHNYWESNRSNIPARMQGDEEWGGEDYRSAIDDYFARAGNDGSKSVKILDLPHFFEGDNYDKSTTLWDFLQLEYIKILKSESYKMLIGEGDVRTLIQANYEQLVKKMNEQGQKKLALETEIDQYKFFQLPLVELANKYPGTLSYILSYHQGEEILAKIGQGQKTKKTQSLQLQESVRLFNLAVEGGDEVYRNNAQVQVERITSPSIQVSVEQVIVPKKPALVFVNVKNLEKIYLKVYKLDKDDYMSRRREKGFPFKNKAVVFEDEIDLPPAKYQYTEQSTELGLPVLESGFYGIVVNPSEPFRIGKGNPLYQASFLVSNLAVNHFYDPSKGKMVLECVDRSSGEIINDAYFKIFDRQWNSGRGQEYVSMIEAKGSPRFEYTPNRNKNLYPYVEHDDNYFFLVNGLYQNDYSESASITSNLLTDRGIYRPGQEIHFHGILLRQSQEQEPKILKNKKLTVFLNDNFGTEIANLSVETDDFGAYHGVLEIPEGTQNGFLSFILRSKDGQVNAYKTVQLEEYKRPKYEVSFEDSEQALKLDDKVDVSASAVSFSGVPIADARVRYKVYRNTWFPYFYSSYRSYFPQRESTLVVSGETITDKEGRVNFDFLAKKPEGENQGSSFSFRVELEVIDNTGETISASKSFNIAEQSVYIKFDQEDSKQFKISTVNSENQGLFSELSMLIYKRKSGSHKIDRYWSSPDTTIVDVSRYPDFSFVDKEEDYSEQVYEAQIALDKEVTMDLADLLGPGDFKVVLKASGAEDYSSYFVLNNFDSGQFGNDELFYVEETAKEIQPGEQFRVRLGSNISGLQVHVSKYRGSILINEEWLTLQQTKLLAYAISEEDYGGFSLQVKAFYKNRIHSENIDVRVPWKHKEVLIKAKSMRLVTEPGSPEKWTFEITDNKGEPLKAKVLASMYDASLDQFTGNEWQWNLYPSRMGVPYFDQYSFGTQYLYTSNYRWNQGDTEQVPWEQMPRFKYGPQRFYMGGPFLSRSRKMSPSPPMEADMEVSEARMDNMAFDEVQVVADASKAEAPASPPPAVRTNLSELVFFYPDLETDEDGNLVIEFTNNEALTKWKFQNFAYTQDLKYGFFSEEIVTRKELMIQANQPRFLRTGDYISLSAKVVNLSDSEHLVQASLSIVDQLTKATIPLVSRVEPFTLEAGAQKEVFWKIRVPKDVSLAQLTYSVDGSKHQDAEQYSVPVLPNEIYLIDSETVLLDANSKGVVDVANMLTGNRRSSALTIESTGSPAWYAMRSLPYLMEKEDENSEAVFNRYFANALALKILEDNPLVQKFYSDWLKKGNLESQLSLNDALKNIDLAQTPWLQDALSEEEVMKNMSMLFQTSSIEKELKRASEKLRVMQTAAGGFPWYEGGRPNYFMSQYILEGILRLEDLGIKGFDKDLQVRLFDFCGKEALEVTRYDMIPSILIRNVWISTKIDRKVSDHYQLMLESLKSSMKQDWHKYGLQEQVYISRIFLTSDPKLSSKIAESLLEKSFYKEQLGRFWNRNQGSIYSSWDISLQASMIALFDELTGHDDQIGEMKFWLISNKRSNAWSSSIATSDAIYALSLGTSSSFGKGSPIVTRVNKEVLRSDQVAGLNYRKDVISGAEKVADISSVTFENSNDNKAWGNVHHQFFQDYEDVVRTDNDFLDIKKEVYLIAAKDDLKNVEGIDLKLGDRIRVRLVVNADRPMDFVHISDDRPAGAEPSDLSSAYVWKNRAGYYKSIKDLGTHFFVDHLAKGRYVFEYDMFINNLGTFNAGVAEIQNVYAPEFNDYSKSISLEVVE